MGFNSGFKGLKAGQNPPRFVGPIGKGKEEDYFEIFLFRYSNVNRKFIYIYVLFI
jgi:hypothetical protein